MTTVSIVGVGVFAPGLMGWDRSAAVLRGEAPYCPAEFTLPSLAVLHSRERRRVSFAVQIALAAAEEARSNAALAATDLSSVFSSSLGDGILLNALLTALADPCGKVSPTQFHNSVHNAAAGYWTIATGNHHPSTSIAAFDFTFAMGLVKTAAQTVCERRTVLLTVFDHPFPEPLNQVRPVVAPFAAGIVVSGCDTTSTRIGRMSLQLTNTNAATAPKTAALTKLWAANPAARAVPLLEVIATAVPATIYVESGDEQCLRIDYEPQRPQ